MGVVGLMGVVVRLRGLEPIGIHHPAIVEGVLDVVVGRDKGLAVGREVGIVAEAKGGEAAHVVAIGVYGFVINSKGAWLSAMPQ